MKRIYLCIAALGLTCCFMACNSGENTTEATTTETTDSSAGSISNNTTNNNNATTTSGTANKLPLSGADSTFVIEAAAGGMMEVEAGTLAQQNAQSERVKAFGAMMVKDHQAANQELMSIASGRGVMAPTTLPPAHQKMVDAMRNMKGKAFDNHYMGMMVKDHQKDVANFQKQANSGSDPELKAFASKTLPVLQMHKDSATAINKIIK
jgi:putative membrane protein